MFLAGHPSQGCFGLQSHCAPCYFFNQASFYPSDFSFTVWKIIKKWIPQKHESIINFVDSKSIREFMEEDQLPACMGGTSTKMYEPKEGYKDGDESD
ncbi:motile sperm domain-containing protein 2 [Trichonephila clavipes]|nr:motile sperm domain-containing protein 2 [Trichonephila clavipes]